MKTPKNSRPHSKDFTARCVRSLTLFPTFDRRVVPRRNPTATMTRCRDSLLFTFLLLLCLPFSNAFVTHPSLRYPSTATTRWSHPIEETTNTVRIWKQHTRILSQALSDFVRRARLPLVAAATAAMLLAGPLPADAAGSGGRMGGSFSRSSSSYSSRSYYYGGSSGRSYYSPSTLNLSYRPYQPVVPVDSGGAGAILSEEDANVIVFSYLALIGFIAYWPVSAAITASRIDQRIKDRLTTAGTVLRLNVALDVANRDDPSSILSVLDHIANTTGQNTSTRAGVQQLTKQVALELLRRKSSMASAFGQVQYCKEERQGQRLFNEWSVRERIKFEKETINRFGGVDFSMPRRSLDQSDSDMASSKATMAVVTLVLLMEESLPKGMSIQSLDDVERVLWQVAASAGAVLGAEILWTPEERSEVLTRKEVLADYPELRAL